MDPVQTAAGLVPQVRVEIVPSRRRRAVRRRPVERHTPPVLPTRAAPQPGPSRAAWPDRRPEVRPTPNLEVRPGRPQGVLPHVQRQEVRPGPGQEVRQDPSLEVRRVQNRAVRPGLDQEARPNPGPPTPEDPSREVRPGQSREVRPDRSQEVRLDQSLAVRPGQSREVPKLREEEKEPLAPTTPRKSQS